MHMATKRIRNPLDEYPCEPTTQRRRTTPSFARVIERVMLTQSMQNIFLILEPMLRQVVREEVEKGLVKGLVSLQRCPSNNEIEAAESSPLKLVFRKGLSLPIFTGSKIEDVEGNALELLLVNTSGEKAHPLPHSLKIEIFVVDGDFVSDGRENWSRGEFDRSVLKERAGRRPLLNGDVALTMRDGAASLGDLTITDNSSWVRSRNFRIGARVVSASCPALRIQEAITECFPVKDHRGELYKKNYPPSLHDDVWRLERIAKDGQFHKRLAAEGIHTVQDFLKLCSVNPQKLRTIMGQGMSDKMWEGTTNHARTCVLGDKLYIYRRAPDSAVVLNPICEVVDGMIDGLVYAPRFLPNQYKALVEQLVLEAYLHWNLVEVYEGFSARDALLQSMQMLEGEREYTPPHQDDIVVSNRQAADFEFHVAGGMGALPENLDVNCFAGWMAKASYDTSDVDQSIVYKTLDFSSSDDEGSSLSHSFFVNGSE